MKDYYNSRVRVGTEIFSGIKAGREKQKSRVLEMTECDHKHPKHHLCGCRLYVINNLFLKNVMFSWLVLLQLLVFMLCYQAVRWSFVVGLSPPQATLPPKRGCPALLRTLSQRYLECDHTESETNSLIWLTFSVLDGQLGHSWSNSPDDMITTDYHQEVVGTCVRGLERGQDWKAAGWPLTNFSKITFEFGSDTPAWLQDCLNAHAPLS